MLSLEELKRLNEEAEAREVRQLRQERDYLRQRVQELSRLVEDEYPYDTPITLGQHRAQINPFKTGK